MKRCLLFVSLLCFVISLLGCNLVGLDDAKNVNFYYRSDSVSYKTSSSVLTAELRDCSVYKDDEMALINYYFKGPETENCKSPFPTDVRATKIVLTSEAVNIHVNDRFADIEGLDFTIACACLSKTLMELYQRDQVKIIAARTFSDGSIYIVITKDSLLLWDTV